MRGIYNLISEINGLKEKEKQATVNANSTSDVSFRIAKENLGNYTVFINGLSGSFTVLALESGSA